jgi:hypothetical protein
VTRYVARFGKRRVKNAVLINAVSPTFMQSAKNIDSVQAHAPLVAGPNWATRSSPGNESLLPVNGQHPSSRELTHRAERVAESATRTLTHCVRLSTSASLAASFPSGL